MRTVPFDHIAAAISVRFRRLGHHYRLPEGEGCQRVSTFPASARFRFGDGCLGEVRRGAGLPAGIAGGKRKFPALVLDSDIPTLLRRGAMGALGGQSDFPRDVLAPRKRGVTIPLR